MKHTWLQHPNIQPSAKQQQQKNHWRFNESERTLIICSNEPKVIIFRKIFSFCVHLYFPSNFQHCFISFDDYCVYIHIILSSFAIVSCLVANNINGPFHICEYYYCRIPRAIQNPVNSSVVFHSNSILYNKCFLLIQFKSSRNAHMLTKYKNSI